MKKKILALVLALAMCIALAACGGSSESAAPAPAPASSQSSTSAAASAATESTEAEVPEAEAEQAAAPAEGEGDVGDFHVVINGAKKDVDYEGNPVIIVTYTWTNNSEETTSPMASMITQAFQDGVEMEYGILDHEYNDGMTNVRPGTSIETDAVFSMTSESVVEFEISAMSDMLQSSAPKVTMNFDPANLD